MGLFNKIKTILNKETVTEEKDKEESIKIYETGLKKSRDGFVSRLASLTKKYKDINEEYFNDLEEILIMADIGVSTVEEFIERLKKRVKHENIESPEVLKEIIVDELFIIYVNGDVLSSKINYSEDKPTKQLRGEAKKVLLIGADTFRAGAIEQLKEWAEKNKVTFYGKEESDPASVVYDGVKKSIDEKYDVVLVDTAGRLQNKVNLMKELEKINKVIRGLIEEAPQETLLVIDATTGQNGINQAQSFKEIVNITGIVLTKIDGTAKGGIVLAIKEKVDIPVKYIGFGEQIDDLQVFDIEKYIYGLFKDF